MIVDRNRGLVCGDASVPTTAVFPGNDDDRIAREQRLRERASGQAARDPPASAAASADVVEMAVIARIEEVRREGPENDQSNRDIS